MKRLFIAVSIGLVVTITGCDRGTSGGPGASDPPSKSNVLRQSEETFSLVVPPTSLDQGETQTVSVEIKRGKNFGQDVSLRLASLPMGVTMDPANPVFKHGDMTAKFTLKATEDAALGDFTVAVTGRPATGAEAVSELKLSVALSDSKKAEKLAADSQAIMRQEYVVAAQKRLDQFTEQFSMMKEHTAEADIPSKTGSELKTSSELRVSNAETKLDVAKSKFNELKSSSGDLWDECKVQMEKAFDDLKSVFV